ncbi:uncharacterized protein LOC113271533 [Papaver somniferum]|uniref:uncharacterized protein LOC113271533 n=1 Tax=Papaver somniferum TaxID=3469 RepID=UPI000E6FE71B|nr:uncharacterized protein LOC113271533 [Papaver somniferum]
MVVESEEAIPIPMGIDEEEDDSLALELIPPFFFVDNEEVDSLEDLIPSFLFDESSDLELIPSYFFEEDDDSIQLDLIPQLLFVENEDVGSLNGVRSHSKEAVTPEMNFSELNQIKSDEVYGSALDFQSNKFEITFENSEYLKKLFFHHNKLLSLDCFSLYPDDTPCLFDRGIRTPYVDFLFCGMGV